MGGRVKERVSSVMTPIVSSKWFWVVSAVALALLRVPPPVALALGAVLALLWHNPAHSFTAKVSKTSLKAAVVLMGFGVQLDVVVRVGLSSIGITLVSILFTFGLGWVLARWLKVERDLGLLLSSGTAICGGSAIAAMAPAIGASEVAMAVSMAIVFLLNGVGLVVFPVIGHVLNLSQVQFGVWSALAIHDTSSVVGAAATYGAVAFAVGTTVKLTRALWILPVSFVASRFSGNNNNATVPWFLFGFLAASLVRALLPGAAAGWDAFAWLGKATMVATLFLIGGGMTRASLRLVGWKPLAMAVVLWIAVLSLSLAGVISGVIPLITV